MVLTVVFNQDSKFVRDRFTKRLGQFKEPLSPEEEKLLLHNITSIDVHVGSTAPWGYDDVKDVVEVQADGDELMYIQIMYSNLPTRMRPSKYADGSNGTKMVPSLVQRWFGIDAKYAASCWDTH